MSAPSQTPEAIANEQNDNSALDQQVDAAVRDVENWFVHESTSGPQYLTEEYPWQAIPFDEDDSSAYQASGSSAEDPQASVEENRIKDSARTIEQRLNGIAKARQQAENKLLVRLETEAKLQAEAAARRREDEDLRRKADEDTARRRREDDLRANAQRDEVNQTERELKAIWEEERRLRTELLRLNQIAHEALLTRVREEEVAKLALLAEAQRNRDSAEAIHVEHLARLHSEEESLRQAVARFGLRRTEVEFERQKHDLESRKLEEEKNRLAATEAMRREETVRLRQAAEERLRLEQEQLAARENELAQFTESLSRQRAELDLARQSAEEDARRVADARVRMQEAEDARRQAEQERLVLEGEIFQRAETERRSLEEVRARAAEQKRQFDASIRESTEWETQKIAELDALRFEANSRSQAYGEKERALRGELEALQLAEAAVLKRVQEIESQCLATTEAHERMTEKLVRVEQEAQARAAQEAEARLEIEERIKAETEQLRRLEHEQQQRIEEEIARRAEVESRLQQDKNRYQVEHAARIKVELRYGLGVGSAVAIGEVVSDAEAVEPDSSVDETVPVYQVGNLSDTDPRRRADAVTALARLGTDDSYDLIVNCFDDESSLVRNAAARAVYALELVRPAESFTRALKDASSERRTRIGQAIAESGLAAQAIDSLRSEDRDETYNGLCLLFTMARTGEVQALVQAVESHEDTEVRLAAIRLLKMSGQEELASEAVNRRLRSNRQT